MHFPSVLRLVHLKITKIKDPVNIQTGEFGTLKDDNLVSYLLCVLYNNITKIYIH